ncbi:lipopolysaccharide biosynthesis protein [Marinobacteraceae bacterium S3BR75-40.1]
MALPLSQLPGETIKEVKKHRWLALGLFALVSAAVLLAGFVYPYKYQSEVMIFVDDSNIVGPLMEGAAEQTKISDKASAAKELLWTRDIVEKIATSTKIYGPDAKTLSADKLQKRVAAIRSGITVVPRGETYFAIRYNGYQAGRTYLIAQRLGQLFIERSNEQKRSESRGAFEFIDQQVKAYEAELTQAEKRLKEFKSKHTEGTEEETNSKLASLRGKIELAQLELQEAIASRDSLQKQLNNVSRNISVEAAQDRYAQRIDKLQTELDNLRLRYHDTYPDIVSLEEQIKELKKQRRQAVAEGTLNNSAPSSDGTVNPLYQELKAALVKANADIERIQTRIKNLNQLLAGEEQRMQKVQANKATLAQLTRDMEVNKSIYDDLLRRREKARLSMHLDVEGQGANYQIQEPAQYPTGPEGVQFKMFAAAGLLLGLVAPFGTAAGLLQVDPRVRSINALEEDLGIPVLGRIPDVSTPFEDRVRKRSYVGIGLLAALVAIAYIAIAIMRALDVI